MTYLVRANKLKGQDGGRSLSEASDAPTLFSIISMVVKC